ncbi:PQQ-binding-like beta-propeller repeat protein [Cellulomonas sp. IC4_254]|uniref:outer membrane protein assembly factor BamB family protein n=1 Tax=Cellulomonas sp. IC4_254 TaxID=2714040 RepID=UPI001420BFFC|nr:PQQ-binding-like beta-propeller repeat protein [Cellulomonas sp. IC4_254]NHT16528.1 PQQ-binding-like beta-propeller repeat protein [Cellulomonas sp. IC4_254]
MAGQEAMREVELREEPGAPDAAAGPGDADDAEDARRRARRRWLRRCWPVAVVAVAAVVAVQVVQDARERDRVAAARQVDGVVRYDVGPGLPVTPLGADEIDPRLAAGVVAGGLRVAGEDIDFGRPRAVRAVDAATGAQVWRTQVETQAEATEQPTMRPPECWPAGPADDPGVARVHCLVVDRLATLTGDGGWREDPPTRSRLLTFDAASGALVTERELAPQASAVADDAMLVLGEVVADGTVRVGAEGVTTGEPLWSAEIEGVDLDPVYDPHLQLMGDHVVVWVNGRQHVIGAADGAVQAEGSQVWIGRTGGLLVQDGDPGTVRLAGRDGSGTAVVPALPVQLAVDDGSAPGIEILSAVVDGDRTLRAVEAATGRTVWEAALDGSVDGTPLLLGGVLYGVDATAAWAVDARDGHRVWRTVRAAGPDGEPVRDTSGDWLAPVTDGRALLLVDRDDDGAARLVAWSLRSGAEQWRVPLPPEAGEWVYARDGALYAGAERPVRIGG